jgi:hypothetical protein
MEPIINLPLLIEALHKNSICECDILSENEFAVGCYKFVLDANFLKCDGEKWKVDDIRSIVYALQWKGLIPRQQMFARQILRDYIKLKT